MDGRFRHVGGLLLAPALLAGGITLVVLGHGGPGLALVAAAWFAQIAGRAARRRHQLEGVIQGVTVGEAMETVPLVVAPQATLDTFGAVLDDAGAATVARVMSDGLLLGLVGPLETSRVPRARWGSVRAADAMVETADLPTLAPADALAPAAERLGASGVSGFPVLAEGRVAGILTRLAVGRTLHERWVDAGEHGAAGAAAEAESAAEAGHEGE